MKIIAYLAKEFGSKTMLKEWPTLSEEDKADLRRWAEEEMKLLGIGITR